MRTTGIPLLCALLVAALVPAACDRSATVAEEPPGYAEEDDLIKAGGKYDTGYYSNLALELEGTFESSLELDLTDLSPGEQEEWLKDPALLDAVVDQQVKLAKNQLAARMLHLNLTAGTAEFSSKALETRGDRRVLVASYAVQAETLVTTKELADAGISPASLEDTRYSIKVPSDPRNLMARAGESCAEGFDPGHLEELSYFYYFDPDKEGCAIEMSEKTAFHVRSLLSQVETFPEYDRLTADGRLEAAVFFGAADHGPPTAKDWGVMVWRSYAANLRISGWEEVDGLDVGQRYRRERGGIVQVIDLVSPYDLHELGDAAEQLLADMLRTHEILVYNGHSFYGSLDVLAKRESYPEATYQVLFMNSCWSYEYYTKQVFVNKATDEDPTGWMDADVVNNTTTAWFAQMGVSTRKVLNNLLAGAVSGGQDDQGRRYSWQNIIGIVNDEAMGICPEDADREDCRHYRPRARYEIYGVSGVRTNVFQPAP